jgi:hypothetical protein
VPVASQSTFYLVCPRRGGVAIGPDLRGVAEIFLSTLLLRHLVWRGFFAVS